MTREKALRLAKKNGVQFNLSNIQYFLALLFVYTSMFFDINGTLTSFIFILIMGYGIWDVSETTIGRKATIQHLIFRLITTIAIWFICLSAIYLIDILNLK